MGAKVSAEMKLALRLYRDEKKPIAEAARLAGVHVSSLYKTIEKLEKPRAHKKY